MDVYFCFDVEDLVHPDTDEIALELATLLADDGIVGSMYVVGEKARLWERRGRSDVIAAVGLHDVGLHTDHHSIHPTVSEYLEDKGWDDGVAEAMRQEGPGVQDLARLFGRYPSAWATGGSSWGPQIPAATHRMGVPSQVYAHVRAGETGACWFAGQLCYFDFLYFPGGEDAYADEALFAAGLPVLLDQLSAAQRAGFATHGVFACHPTRLRYKAFWDALNYNRGQNTAPADYRIAERRTDAEYQMSLRNLRRMASAVCDLPGVRIVGTGALNHRFGVENGSVARSALGELAQAALDHPGLDVTNPLASPAQTLDLLARGVAHVAAARPFAALPLRTVLGPTEPPPMLGKPITISGAAGAALCAALVEQTTRTGGLPAYLVVDGTRVGPGALLRGLAAAWAAGKARELPTKFTFTPGAEEPATAAAWVDEWIYGALPGWTPHRPDLQLDRLALHTRLQSWSLKPARAVD